MTESAVEYTTDMLSVMLDAIDPNPYQPRSSEDAEHIQHLADSILRDGLLQIPVGREVVGRIQLAFGHSRLAAFKLLSRLYPSFAAMPVDIRDLTDQQMFEYAVTENVTRKNLTPIEEAKAMQRYRDDFGKTSAEIGELFGISDSTVRGKLRLLDLPESVQENMKAGQIGEASARRLLILHRVRPDAVNDMAVKAIAEDLTPKETEEAIEGELQRDPNAKRMWGSWQDQENPQAGMGFWPLNWEPIQSGMVCTTCPQYLRLNGNHYCCNTDCFNAKIKEWYQEELTRISDEMGIPAYSSRVDGKTFISREFHNGAKFEKWIEENDPGLRLKINYRAYAPHPITNSFCVQMVSVNADAVTTIQAEEKRQEQEKNTYVDVQNRRDQSREFIMEVSKYFAPLIGEPASEVIDLLIDWTKNRLYGYAVGDAPDDAAEKVSYYQRLVITVLFDKALAYETLGQGPQAVAEKIWALSSDWGVWLPESLDELAGEYAEDKDE